MSQNIRATAFSSSGRQGIRAKVDGSGIAIMSDSSIGLKPVIEEPSKPMPPSKASSSSAALIEKLFSWPSTSVNQRRTKRTSFSLTIAATSAALFGCSAIPASSALALVGAGNDRRSEPARGAKPRNPGRETRDRGACGRRRDPV